MRLITIDKIRYFQADNKYTMVVTAATQSLISKTIKDLLDDWTRKYSFKSTAGRWLTSTPSQRFIAICAGDWKSG